MKPIDWSVSRYFANTLLLLQLGMLPVATLAAVTDLANGPLASGITSATTVKPNIAFVVDDSGSMTFESMPADDDYYDRYGDATHTRNKRCFGWHKFNTVFYNPAVTYKPPFKLGGTVYSDNVPRYPDADFNAALKDGYFASGGVMFRNDSGSGTNTTTDLSVLSNLSPDPVSCAAAAGAVATITSDGAFGSSRCYRATSIAVTVGSSTIELLNSAVPSATTCNTDADTFGANIQNSINAKRGTTGFSAVYLAGANRLEITAPASLGNFTATPTINFERVSGSGTETFNITSFSSGSAGECASGPSKYYYATHKTDPASSACEADSNYSIVTDASNIAAPRVATGSAAAKTNYANWYSYYRTRAGLMKAATGEAFKDMDESKYRVGLFFINSLDSDSPYTNRQNRDLKIADFSGSAATTQRYDWYSKLYAGREGGGTPLRGALSRMGRMYAGQISGWDPVQYSCQQNFTILSTDGFWNDADNASYGPKQIDGSTTVGNPDGPIVNAASARATITISRYSGGGSDGCYKVSSVTVNTGATTVELLNAPAPASCTTGRDALGEAVRDSINARTATTRFTATYSSDTRSVTIVAPTSLGDLSATPVVTATKVSGDKTRTVTATQFSGGAAGTTGAPLPYMDALNISNTLADVAYYYYTTDLRDLTRSNCGNPAGSTSPTYSGLCTNNVRGSGKDTNGQQHMTTFTVGLGVNGTITYENNYETADNITNVTQYADIVNGGANWPDPTGSDLAKIDDLWHAAVNGHGTYYSATDSTTLKQGIQSALAGIQARKGSSAAAATSNLEPVAGDNFVYVALYQTLKWDGDLQAFSIDPDTGDLSESSLWSAQAKLDAQVAAAATAGTGDGRTIKFFSAGATNKLKDFTLANLTADSLHGHFESICSKTPAIDQCGNESEDLTAAQKTTANSSANLINYLRGRADHEDESANATAADRVYRGRDHVLGDIVNAVPVYMKKPPFSYDTYDGSYASFKTSNAERAATVFVAANDGMLHAINADSDSTAKGSERWAYVPKLVMPNLWNLADRNYANNHRYFVDGSPTIADICTRIDTANSQLCSSATDWKTILVGGLNKGGCGYYALDVTDPTNPKGLWEFTDPNLGYSYGNPIVAKRRSDGLWVVIFASGYNNVPGNGCGNTGDGNGHVFVVNAATGELLDDIETYTSLPGTTQVGSTDAPSGLAKLNAWIEDAALPNADRLYGGDMLGNVWRIDFDNRYLPAGKEAVRLAQLKDGSSSHNPQPITTKPELAVVTAGGTEYPVVMVGSGKYLGTGDISDTSQQSVYALKDTLGTTGIADVRGSTMVSRTLTQTTGSAGGRLEGRTIRTVSGDTMDWASKNGWYLDFNPGNTSPGERVNVDMALQFNILTVAANVPATNACDVGGYAFLYFVDFNNGMNLSTATDSMAGIRLAGNALVAGIKTVKLTSGKTVTIVTDTAGNVSSEDNPSATGGGAGTIRRTTWREIPD